jgi:hypothetical protein
MMETFEGILFNNLTFAHIQQIKHVTTHNNAGLQA